jgi:hypothetical protein
MLNDVTNNVTNTQLFVNRKLFSVLIELKAIVDSKEPDYSDIVRIRLL